MKISYNNAGYLDAVNADDGRTLAVLITVEGERVLHPEYDNEVGNAAIAGLLLFDPDKVKPEIEYPEPELGD